VLAELVIVPVRVQSPIETTHRTHAWNVAVPPDIKLQFLSMPKRTPVLYLLKDIFSTSA